MSYDISLKDRVTGETIEVENVHFMTGGTFAVGGTKELWLNITYNYANYYYDATDGDERFANDDHDGGRRYGIRGIYGKTGAESIPMLKDMIARIEAKYKINGKWITTTREKSRYYNEDGVEIDAGRAFGLMLKGKNVSEEKYKIDVCESTNDDYWEPTAGNAIRPLYQLIAFAEMRPDGVWDGD